jgi:hypothetical protein
MTTFSSTALPGQRWKMFLPGAASIQSNALSMSTASVLIRCRWLNGAAPFAGTSEPASRQGGVGSRRVQIKGNHYHQQSLTEIAEIKNREDRTQDSERATDRPT